ncbi:hypothetical protein [Varibaculum vaginae]|uniref:hypothetical protein n=1 Tax=Varibaculum vaginae TaxID=2364797 RepID=UPI000F07F56A|nr:hypothetical protein [Varibaculum vaginae]
MNNKVLRVIGICAGTALLSAGISGCSTVKKAGEDFPVDQVVSEINAAQVDSEQQKGQALQVQQMRSQLQKGLGNEVYPQAVWEAIARGRMLPVHLASSVGVVKVAQHELRKQPGYTDADINTWLSKQVKQGVLRHAEFSAASLDFWRLQKFTIDTQQGAVSQELVKRVAPKLSAAYKQGVKQAAGLKTNALLSQAVATQTGVQVLEPDLGSGVRLQGLGKAAQALQGQMQQGEQPAK